jgi:hypothetical protein
LGPRLHQHLAPPAGGERKGRQVLRWYRCLHHVPRRSHQQGHHEGLGHRRDTEPSPSSLALAQDGQDRGESSSAPKHDQRRRPQEENPPAYRCRRDPRLRAPWLAASRLHEDHDHRVRPGRRRPPIGDTALVPFPTTPALDGRARGGGATARRPRWGRRPRTSAEAAADRRRPNAFGHAAIPPRRTSRCLPPTAVRHHVHQAHRRHHDLASALRQAWIEPCCAWPPTSASR